MAYSVQHVRFTLECDACGLLEKRELARDDTAMGTHGWGSVSTPFADSFCCPDCLAKCDAILHKQARAAADALKTKQSACVHNYQQRGFLQQCTKCEKWK